MSRRLESGISNAAAATFGAIFAAESEPEFRCGPSRPADEAKMCSCCGHVYSVEEWRALPSLREWPIDEEEVLQIAECAQPGCGTTISRPAPRST